ncbi:hypothetical protein CK203_055468 [Vitis vinifera]|uniref:Retrotransposon gag domain-containing protein n=1 Tax=Vitis vinifera TaxID=29760 RepID=A0A438GJA8_VITVI|nr:hypothetical protein CK203_055468 [Vitis vinifera]
MLATQTLPTISHDQATGIPPIVTPVTIIEDSCSHMDRLEQGIRQMRDPDETIYWDDTDDMPVAILLVGFKMPEIKRYTGVGCPRIHLKLYNIVMRALGLDEAQLLTLFPLSLSDTTQRCSDTNVTHRELEFLRQRLDESVSSFISRWREKTTEMIERPTDRDQMCMFLRSLQPSYGDVYFASFQHQRPSYHPYARSLQIPRSDFPPSQHRHPQLVQQYPSMHPYIATDLIDSGVVSFSVSTPNTDLGPDMTADSFPAYSTHAVPPPSGLYHHVLDTQGTDIHKIL